MENIYEWVKNMVFFYIWLTAILHILPQNNYQKYVKFFGRLLLVVLILTPLLDFLYRPDYLLDKVSYESFWQEMDTIKLDMMAMEDVQKHTYMERYEKAIGEDIVLMVQQDSMEVQEVAVSLTEEYQVKEIFLVINLGQSEEVYIEKMVLQDNSQEYSEVLKLKEKIMNFYNVTEEQIQIMVQEG